MAVRDPRLHDTTAGPDGERLHTHLSAAVAAARAAQLTWAALPLKARLAIVRRLRQATATKAYELASAGAGVLQRPVAEVLVAEVLPLADACRFLERQAERILAPQRLTTKGRPFWLQQLRTEIRREPFGVVLIVGPSNYPLFLPGVQMLQALVAGNAVLCKPGQGGRAVALELTALLETAGLDARLVHVLPESPDAVHAAIATGVDKVLLTGSTATGTAVLAALAPHVVPATLELSGSDAAFVRPDANLDLVVQALVFSLRLNGGATCIAPRRVFVPHALAPVLEARLVQAVRELAPHPITPAIAVRLQALVADACRRGARLCTGAVLPDNRVTPFVLGQAAPAMRLLQEDILAPILALVGVADDDEALAAAQSCPYALGATVFGSEVVARALAARVRAGVVIINDVIVPTADPRLPFGGRGQSGFGVTRGAEGLLALTTVKAIAIRRGQWRPHFVQPMAQDEALFRAYIAAAHGAAPLARARAGCTVVWSLLKRTGAWRWGRSAL